MGTSSGANLHDQSPARMLPPRQDSQSIVLQTSLSLVSPDACDSLNLRECGSNYDQVHESPEESASSRETWPDPDAIMAKKREKEKEGKIDCAEVSVVHRVSGSDKISIRDVARERVDKISEKMQHLPQEFVEELKNVLRAILGGSGGSHHREEFLILQKLLQNRDDLTIQTLIRAHRVQLEILVAIKTGIQAFLHPSISLSQTCLIEIFMLKRCRNIACQSQLPADDCTCEVCNSRNGFCSLCMCVVCEKFDFEVNTTRWIGCDSCSHWTHTDCAIREGQLGMGGCVKSRAGHTAMLFSCRACNWKSEVLGWVKDVFQQCAPGWDREMLMRELDSVSRIFRGSEDPIGQKLFWKCEDLIEKVKGGVAESIACKAILHFFQELGVDSKYISESERGRLVIAPQEACDRIAEVVQDVVRKMEMVEEEKMWLFKKARVALEACEQDIKDKAQEVAELNMERQQKQRQIDELESIVRLKQAEADMFQLKASEARREADRLQRIALTRSEKVEEDYCSRYLRLRLNEAEAEKLYLIEKIKLQESSRASRSSSNGGDPSQRRMFCKIQDLLKNVHNESPKAETQPIGPHTLGSIP